MNSTQKMEYACKCLINSLWWFLQSLQVSEIIDVKNSESSFSLSDQRFCLIKRLFGFSYKLLDIILNLVTDYRFSLCLFIFNFDFSLFSNDNSRLLISTLFLCLYFYRHYFQVLFKLSYYFTSFSKFEYTSFISIQTLSKFALFLCIHNLE